MTASAVFHHEPIDLETYSGVALKRSRRFAVFAVDVVEWFTESNLGDSVAHRVRSCAYVSGQDGESRSVERPGESVGARSSGDRQPPAMITHAPLARGSAGPHTWSRRSGSQLSSASRTLRRSVCRPRGSHLTTNSPVMFS